MILAFGFVFLLPVVVWLLSKLGVINYRMLENNRKYAILFIFVIAAVLTPPDIFSQVMMALPLLGLYELSIWIAKITGREEK
jgi:sec-independent protein translocase protein TatC